jgi:SOS response regulatory protein OraA/RecX
VAAKKWKSIKGAGLTDLTRQSKTRAYLQQRGFESNVISMAIRKIREREESV